MPELKTPTQALAAALLLAITAPHDTVAADVIRQADAIAAGMPPADVDRVKEVVEIALAMLPPAAMGAPQLTDAEAAEPFPVADVLPADRVKMGQNWPGCLTPEGGWPMVRWARQWWPAPTVGEAHAMALDSVAETPDGRTVETDDPQSWPSLLGLI